MPREPKEVHDQELQIDLLTVEKAVYKYLVEHPLASDCQNKYCALCFVVRDPAPGQTGVYEIVVRDTDLDPQSTKHKLIIRLNYISSRHENKDVSLSIEHTSPHTITFYSEDDNILETGSEEQLIKIAKELIQDFEAVCIDRGGHHRGRVSSFFGSLPVAEKEEYILRGLESMVPTTLSTSATKQFFGEELGWLSPEQFAAQEQQGGGEQHP